MWGAFATKIVLLLLSPKSKELEEELPASELLTSLFGVQEPNNDSERVKTNKKENVSYFTTSTCVLFLQYRKSNLSFVTFNHSYTSSLYFE